MSTIICLKEAGRVVLGTDSRFMSDRDGVESDSIPKITRINETDAFIATTGWRPVGDFHAAAVCELAHKLGTSDIRVLASALDRASAQPLNDLVRVLIEGQHEYPRYASTVTGQGPLQGFMLAGRAAGMLGYLYCEYWYRDGQVTRSITEYFGSERNIRITGIEPAVIEPMKADPTVRKGTAVAAVRRLLEVGRQSRSSIGGPDQIVMIDYESGAHWIDRPLLAGAVCSELAHATITAAVSLTTADLTCTHNNVTTEVKNAVAGSTYAGLSVKNNTSELKSVVAPAWIWLENAAGHKLVSVDGGGGYGYISLKNNTNPASIVIDAREANGITLSAPIYFNSGANSYLKLNELRVAQHQASSTPTNPVYRHPVYGPTGALLGYMYLYQS